jgi:hypothetical protein
MIQELTYTFSLPGSGIMYCQNKFIAALKETWKLSKEQFQLLSEPTYTCYAGD